MNRIVITGGPGFGKSSVIKELEKRGYFVFHEVSREIMEEQKKSNGDIVPWKNHHAFNEAVFKGRLEQYHAATKNNRIYFFDRGLPDSLAYLQADEKSVPNDYLEEVKTCSYYHKVFVTPIWTEIYQTDQQRWENIDYANKVHEEIVHFYSILNYEIINLPKESVEKRADFIIEILKKDFADFT